MTRSVPLTRAQQAKRVAGDISFPTAHAARSPVAGRRDAQLATISRIIRHHRLWTQGKKRCCARGCFLREPKVNQP